MINWVNFLHIYQPPYQEKEVIEKVSKESYWKLVEILKRNKQAKITLSFSGCLLEHLYAVGEEKLIEEFKKLVEDKQIELVGSARYHPILPLLPANEIKRQIALNDQILRQAFAEYYQPAGFFLPEMAYSAKVAKILKKLGYKWLILDEIAYKGRLGLVDYNRKYKIKGVGLQIIFRNRGLSKTFVPEIIIELTKKSNPPTYLVSATDGEMYGHHHRDGKNLFEQALKNPYIKTLTISEYLSLLPSPPETIAPLASSWESTSQELKKKLPYALWQNPKNKIHQNLWELRKIAIRVVNTSKEKGENYDWARHHLDRGLASCAWWWAADKKLDIFDFITWNPDTIEKGIKELISSIRSLKYVSQKTKLKAEKLYHLLIKEVWKKHWRKYHKQPGVKKMPPEIKRALSLLNQNFIISLFEKKIKSKIFKGGKIDYIAIKTFKQKIGKLSFYHIVARYTIYFRNKKIKPVVIFCNANSKEPRLGAYLALEYLQQNNFSRGQLFSPFPLFYHQQLKAMFYLEASGKNLYQFIINPRAKFKFKELIDIVKLTGQWLAKLHNLPTEGVKNFNPVQSKIATIIPGPKHFLKVIKIKHRDFPKYHQKTEELFEKIEKLEKQLIRGEKKYIIHGDFHPENVIYNKKKNILSVIDYTDCCLAHFTRDLGSFYQQLAYMSKGCLLYLQIKQLQRIFIISYQKARDIKLTKEDQKRFNLYKAWTALRSAIFFLTITPFDRPRAEALFAEAEDYLKKVEKI